MHIAVSGIQHIREQMKEVTLRLNRGNVEQRDITESIAKLADALDTLAMLVEPLLLRERPDKTITQANE